MAEQAAPTGDSLLLMLTLDEYFDLPERPYVEFEMLDGKLGEI